MKKFMYLVMVGATLLTGFTTFGVADGCGLGEGIRDHVSHILSTYRKEYKDDAMVQAILNKDCAKVEMTAIDSKKRLHVEVIEDKNFKAVCECDYIGLTFGLLTLQEINANLSHRQISKEDIQVVSRIIKSLLKKDMSPKGTYTWIPYEYKRGRWIQQEWVSKGTNAEFAQKCKKEPTFKQIASMFS
jgi:hypothetical protein